MNDLCGDCWIKTGDPKCRHQPKMEKAKMKAGDDYGKPELKKDLDELREMTTEILFELAEDNGVISNLLESGLDDYDKAVLTVLWEKHGND